MYKYINNTNMDIILLLIWLNTVILLDVIRQDR